MTDRGPTTNRYAMLQSFMPILTHYSVFGHSPVPYLPAITCSIMIIVDEDRSNWKQAYGLLIRRHLVDIVGLLLLPNILLPISLGSGTPLGARRQEGSPPSQDIDLFVSDLEQFEASPYLHCSTCPFPQSTSILHIATTKYPA